MSKVVLTVACVLLSLLSTLASAEELCDPAFQNCLTKLVTFIKNETVRLDVAYNLLEDQTITDAIIARRRAGVPVRVIMEPRRNSTNPLNKTMVDRLKAAGIPIRQKPTGGIFHWKMVMFAGQQVVEFAAANFTADYFRPRVPYVDYYSDPVYFSRDLALVRSFQRKFDDIWVDTTNLTDYANVTTRARAYPAWTIDPTLSFVPWQNFLTRSKPLYDAETRQIDTIMYKITEPGHADGLIRARSRGIPVRLIVEGDLYRSTRNLWQAYNVDRLYAAGVRIRVRAHAGFLHQKTTLLYGQATAVFGSSNWTLESNSGQWEHNYFTRKTWFFTWMRDIYNRKWNNSTGNVETKAFVPLPPAAPVYVSPAQGATALGTTVTLKWKPGYWGHRADLYFGTSSTPPLYLANLTTPAGATATKSVTISGLTPGRTYYWRVVSKTMAPRTAAGTVRSFGT
jgi:phosphatidylserine/phosphatidylglycerophosphate/cardiolipin synthase-like enzyme